MKQPSPPLTPALIAGMFLRPVPRAVIDRALSAAMNKLLRHHEHLFERLPALGAGDGRDTLLIDPTDLPVSMVLTLDPAHPELRSAGPEDEDRALAAVRGPVEVLIDLLEGRVDGDALFFSRELTFEGDTEAVVALRNAMDGAEIKLADLTPLPAPLARAGAMAAGVLAQTYQRAAQDLETVRRAAVRPLDRRADGQAATIERLENRIDDLEKKLRREKARARKSG